MPWTTTIIEANKQRLKTNRNSSKKQTYLLLLCTTMYSVVWFGKKILIFSSVFQWDISTYLSFFNTFLHWNFFFTGYLSKVVLLTKDNFKFSRSKVQSELEKYRYYKCYIIFFYSDYYIVLVRDSNFLLFYHLSKQ